MEDSKWQTELTTVRERNEYVFNKSLFCDVEFCVVDSHGDTVTLQANKYVLAISSPVFEAMFYRDLAETGRKVDLPDCSKEGLQEMLRYVYSDKVDLTGSNIMDVLYVAQKYMMPFLETKCNEYLQKELQPEDVFIVLPQAQKSSNVKAEQCCWNVVDFETQRALTSEPFLNISRELLCQVLARETLNDEEINIFKAVDKWASNQIKENELEDEGSAKRDVLGKDVIRLVRFPVMSHREFAEFVLDSNILTPNEINEIVKLLSSATTSKSVFSTKKRKGQWSEKWSPIRFDNYGNYSCFAYSNPHCIQFQVNKPVFLAGVKLFWAQSEEVQVKLTISKIKNTIAKVSDMSLFGTPKRPKVSLVSEMFSKPNGCTLAEVTLKETPTFIDRLYHGFIIYLDDPVPLKPNEWHLIEAEFNGYTRFAGTDGRDVVECDDITIIFKNAADSTNTTVQNGQFPSFLLKRKIELR